MCLSGDTNGALLTAEDRLDWKCSQPRFLAALPLNASRVADPFTEQLIAAADADNRAGKPAQRCVETAFPQPAPCCQRVLCAGKDDGSGVRHFIGTGNVAHDNARLARQRIKIVEVGDGWQVNDRNRQSGVRGVAAALQRNRIFLCYTQSSIHGTTPSTGSPLRCSRMRTPSANSAGSPRNG